MSALLKQIKCIETEIRLHTAWLGRISGLKAEKMFSGVKTPYLYVLREGENENDYYVTFTHPDGSVRHQPFIITVRPEGWYWRNHGAGGPYTEASIEDVLYLIMHCEREENVPLTLLGS